MKLHTQALLAHGGEAIARDEQGRVVFIEGAATDEEVEVEIIQSKKSFARARVLEVLKPSPDRVEPECKHFGACGGCVTQHVDIKVQTESKQQGMLENLRRIGKIDLSQIQVDSPWSGTAYGYRHRARLGLAPGPTLGFRGRNSNRIVDIEHCPVLSPATQSALTEVRQLKLRARGLEEFDVVANEDSALVRLPHRHQHSLDSARPESKTEFAFGKQRKTIEADDGRGRLLLSPGVFSQSNVAGNVAVIDYVSELLGKVAHLLELYAGSGNFTRGLLAQSAQIEIVESTGLALDFAREVLPESVIIHAGLVEDVLAKRIDEGLSGGAVLLDPPRAGLSEKVIKSLNLMAAESLIYVSCDPASFARDLARLSPTYKLTRVRLFDLYPQTAHSEVIGLLKHK